LRGFQAQIKQNFGRKTLGFELDNYNRKILDLLQTNARMSWTEIGRQVHLTAPAVAERVRQLEEAKVITGYRAVVNLRQIGYSFEALIQVTVDSHDALDAWAARHQEVLALHATTGEHCALLRLGLRDPEHLQALLKSLGNMGKTSTAMVLSTHMEDRTRIPADQLGAEGN
jgi:Lrp/AsnC family leucine-responsive transcriptional regulator